MTVRTRIGPSPTGDPHVGTAYVALMNYIFSKKNQGRFILRIEDTDRVRSSETSEKAIVEALNWLGLRWDEGPDVGGAYGPYRQSERLQLYRQHVDLLLDKGHAFHCFCTPQRLDAIRAEQIKQNQRSKYDGHCLSLSTADIAQKHQAGEPSVVRMKIPQHGECAVPDMLRGTSRIPWEAVDMQVLLKSDGYPTYHLANVVDDHLMEISHIIRGEEWINSTPKHIQLYEYFGWQPPQYCHLPLLRNHDKTKLSKRKNPTGILYYKAMGYLPEALINFLGLFGLSMQEGEEKMDFSALVDGFDLSHITLGGPVFNTEKLNWLNGRYLRELPPEHMQQRYLAWLAEKCPLDALTPLVQSRVNTLGDIMPLATFLFAGHLPLNKDQIISKKLDETQMRQSYQVGQWCLDDVAVWDLESIENALRQTADKLALKFRDMVPLFYLAIAGSTQSLPLFNAMAFIGREVCRERLRNVLTSIGEPSKKELKTWEKIYRNTSNA